MALVAQKNVAGVHLPSDVIDAHRSTLAGHPVDLRHTSMQLRLLTRVLCSFRHPGAIPSRSRSSTLGTASRLGGAFALEQVQARRVSSSQASTSQDPPPNSPSRRGSRSWPNGGGTVHLDADVHPSVVVETGAVVQKGAVIQRGACIGACSVVGSNVTLGERTVVWHNVSLQHCTIGQDCVLHNGVSIGQDGFGFFVNEQGEMVKKPQELKVIIGNHVEIGANSCVDRGSWRDTEIGDHTKLDNLVQIGHNVKIGRCCLLCGQVGVGGSAELGDYTVLGGKAGVADHVKVHSKVRLAAKSGAITDIKEEGDYAGFPAVPAREWRRSTVALRKLGRDAKLISNLSLSPEVLSAESLKRNSG